jgi:protein-tyrosine phosphatase
MFFQRSAKHKDYHPLGTDYHSHLLPGIDDGAKDMADSLKLIRGLQELGYQSLYTTPHIMRDYYPNTSEGIREKAEEVKQALAAEGIQVQLEAAAEYFLDEHFEELVEKEDLLCLPDRQVLVEFSTLASPRNYADVFFRLRTKGYQPLLAHPERYVYWSDKKLTRFQQLKNQGVRFQMNLLSLVGHYGKPQQQLARRLLKAGWIDCFGTDLHHEGHIAGVEGRDYRSIRSKRFKRV